MGREVRRVPANWQHPKERGHYKPLHDGSATEAIAKWDEGSRKWDEGLVEDWGQRPDGTWGTRGWKPKTEAALGSRSFAEWHGGRPAPADYMPDWSSEERTHFQMYETTTEGTPISPVCATPEELARWLADNNASACGSEGASYEAWLSVCRSGWAPSMIGTAETGLVSGVEGMAALEKRDRK